MAVVNTIGLDVPYQNTVTESSGLLTQAWLMFFRKLFDIVSPLGIEKYAQVSNNQVVAADIDGMQFNNSKVNQVMIDFVIQRTTTGAGAVDIVSSGMLIAVYKPGNAIWNIRNAFTAGPDASGVTFTITTGGQVQYTSSNVTGTAKTSKITYRARTMNAKV